MTVPTPYVPSAVDEVTFVTVGTVVSITDATPVQSPIFYNYGAPAPAADGATTPVKPGTQDLGASVTVVFAIL